MKEQEITLSRIYTDVHRTLKGAIQNKMKFKLLNESALEGISKNLLLDLNARVLQDPTAISTTYIYTISRSFKAIFFYRLANYLYCLDSEDLFFKSCAYRLSEYATARTMIEIHPQAKIGHSFVIDHGVNTLIGATCEIGNNCTFLNNIVLGSKKITYNENKKRHPTIGDNVHISSGAKIFGAICIGNNVIIGPDCVITENIPNDKIVKLKKTQMVISSVKK
ncbi:serine acetyltransferase [Sphingobacterium sp. DR205]|uniref:serine O-acetyltransferase n=1 Tax=Sphingobacterium sp. DR205 TaxID=2713573 RepID=UPI0013E4EFA7|nr:serine acetyltransferase [Sphingobacterium sp. DR205]QIH33421.1 serine acetyltransferase [Sphingobacterium sp. DR205]